MLLRKTWIFLDTFLYLEQYVCFPVIKSGNLIVFVNGGCIRLLIACFNRFDEGFEKLGFTSGCEGNVLCRIFATVSFRRNPILSVGEVSVRLVPRILSYS